MHEEEKFKEAEYFLTQMINEKGNTEAFKFNLSAFLTAARSVLLGTVLTSLSWGRGGGCSSVISVSHIMDYAVSP